MGAWGLEFTGLCVFRFGGFVLSGVCSAGFFIYTLYRAWSLVRHLEGLALAICSFGLTGCRGFGLVGFLGFMHSLGYCSVGCGSSYGSQALGFMIWCLVGFAGR